LSNPPERISNNLIKLLQREQAMGRDVISDQRYAYLSRVAFRGSGMDFGDLYSFLQMFMYRF
jgi:hypothetical protein